MTDLRDPKPGPELKSLRADAEASRPTMVARALAPIRRVTGFEPSGVMSRDLELRASDERIVTAPAPGREWHALRWSFILLVLLPLIAFGVYLYLIASDQYQAEARFAVRQADPIGGSVSMNVSTNGAGATEDSTREPNAAPTAAGTSYLSSSTLGGQDAEIVANYIHSRAIIDDISRTIDIRAIFRRPEADVVARLSRNASEEDLLIYWDKMVSVYIEGSSGIVTTAVSAFRREDALLLADAIVKSSEKLVNSLSAKVQADAIRTAEEEVRRSDGEVRFALAALTSFRNKNHFIDPTIAAETTSKLLLQLLGDQIQAEAELYIAQRTQGPEAPGIGALRAKLDSINSHIRDLKDQMAGGRQLSGNLAATLAQFEGLDLKLKFAERMYGFARDGVERARIQAMRQSVYLALFVPPSLPQEYAFPLRATDLILVGLSLLMLWVSGVTITASVLDHRL